MITSVDRYNLKEYNCCPHKEEVKWAPKKLPGQVQLPKTILTQHYLPYLILLSAAQPKKHIKQDHERPSRLSRIKNNCNLSQRKP